MHISPYTSLLRASIEHAFWDLINIQQSSWSVLRYGYILFIVIDIISFTAFVFEWDCFCVYGNGVCASIWILYTCVLNSYWNSISDFLWPFESEFGLFRFSFFWNPFHDFLFHRFLCQSREWAVVRCECLNNTLILSSLLYTCFIIIRANVLIWLVNQGANSNNISEVLGTFANQHWNERHVMDVQRAREWMAPIC